MDNDDEKSIRQIMELISAKAKDWQIEQAIRHAIMDAFLRGAKHGMDMSR